MGKTRERGSAISRAFAVLDAIVHGACSASLAEIVAAVRLPKPTVYRVLAQLETAGLVQREPEGKRFTGGSRLTQFALNVMMNSTARGARHLILQRLVDEIGETCNFTMLDGAQVIYLDRVETPAPLRMNLQAGSRVPTHCTASGKLLLATLPRARRERLLRSLPLTRYTDNTITDRRRFARELEDIRAQGYSTDNEEFHQGLACVAVPVSNGAGRPCAALAVHAPVSRKPLELQLEHLPSLRRAAGEIARTFRDESIRT